MTLWSCKNDPQIVQIEQIFFGYNFARFNIWGGARVVEWDSLENYCGLRSTEGSNPSLSAEKPDLNSQAFCFPPSAPIWGWYSNPSLSANKDFRSP